MKSLPSISAIVLVGSIGLPGAGAAESLSTAYDGEWSVVLACPDTQDKNGLVKGYEFNFAAVIKEGRLLGQYGAKGAPASVVFTGEVRTDGTLEIQATGHTGLSDRSVGKVAQGTPYSYTMSGKLEQLQGEATRRELRPCTARFGRR